MWRLLQWLRPQNTHEKALVAFVRKCFQVYPKNIELYKQALRHGSAVPKGAEGAARSNERLEFLGDAILDSIVAEYLYTKHDDWSEGDLTKLKAKVVSRKTLNQLGSELGIEEYLEVRMGNQPIQQTLIGNALEALIGALYLDHGYRATERAVMKLLHKFGVDGSMYDLTDFKSKLHEHCQKKKKHLAFKVIKEKEHANDVYKMIVEIDHQLMGVGTGRSKKGAEQAAARVACAKVFQEIN
jgi:ribonuclease-3